MKKTISLIANGISKNDPEILGDILGLQYTWESKKLDRVCLIDEEKWFLARFGESFVEFLNNLNIPIIVSKKWSGLKNQIMYPLEKIIEKFGIEYFTCSQAYMIALALYEGYEQIRLIGWGNYPSKTLDFEWNSIIWDEIICQNFWVGFAKGMGVEVIGGNVGMPITMHNEKLYGYNVSEIHKRKRKEIIDERNYYG